MTTPSSRSWLSTALVVALVAAFWFFLAPKQLGGPATYVVTHGGSMAKAGYHSGDLAILHGSSAYKVNDIAGYRDTGGFVVLHRIIRIDGTHYIFKGDSNDYIDGDSTAPPYITSSVLVGKLWLHVPKLGTALTWIQKPVHAGILVLIALLLSSGGTLARRRGRGEQSTERGAGASFGASFPRISTETRVLAAAAAVTGVFALLALVAFTKTPTKSETVASVYTVSGTWSYGARTKPSVVYPSGRVRTGDAVFAKLVHSIQVGFQYRISSLLPVRSHGTGQLVAHVEGDNLWKDDLPLGPKVPLDAESTTLHGTLHLDGLIKRLLSVEKEIGVPPGSTYTLTISPNIHQDGRAGTQALTSRFEPILALRFDKVRLSVDTSTTSGAMPSFTESQSGDGTQTVPAPLNLKVVTLGVRQARVLGLAGTGIGLLLLGLLALLTRGRRSESEPTKIEAQYGNWLVPVAHYPEMTSPPAEVGSFEALVALAERYDLPVMHVHEAGLHSYLLKEEGLVYRYQARDDGPPAEHDHGSAELDSAPPLPQPVAHVQAAVEEALLPQAPPVQQVEVPAAPPAPVEPWPEPSYALPAFDTPVVPVEELPQAAPLAPPVIAVPPSIPLSTAPAPAPVPVASAGQGFVPESPETSYQPAPIATPAPIAVPPQPAPLTAAPTLPAQPTPSGPPAGIVPIVPLAPAPQVPSPDVALIRDTFLRPRPRQGDGGTAA